MKKYLIGAVCMLSMSGLVSCVPGNTAADKEDSIRAADSLAALEAQIEQQRQQQALNDSLWKEEAEQQYQNAITITPGKKDVKHMEESSFYRVTWPCTLTNNTPVALSPNDYEVTYQETYEGHSDGGDLTMLTKTHKQRGPQLPPDSIGEVSLTGKDATQDLLNPEVKLLMSESDFINKYIEAKKAQETQTQNQ